MKTIKYLVFLLIILFFSCSPRLNQESESGDYDYTKTKVNFLNDKGKGEFKELENGESLMLSFEGLQPNAPVEAFLLDDKNNEWSYARVYANKKGMIAPFLFWYQSGVIGGTNREIDFKPNPSFETFEQAEKYFLKHQLRIELRDLKGNVFQKHTIPFSKRKSAFIYPSNSKGILWNAFNLLEEDLYVTGKGFPSGTEINLYLVPNQYQWNEGDPLKDTRNEKEYLKTIKIGSGKNSFTTKILNKGTGRPGAYDIVAKINGNPRDLRLTRNDIISFHEDTAIVLYMIINGNIVVESAGRMKGGPAKFEFSDAFEKNEDVYGAVDPSDVPAVHAGGNYAAYYVVEDQPNTYWDGASPVLTDVSGGIEIQRVKYWCINASRRLIWPNATQAQGIKGYDVIVDFGATPANTSSDFVIDNNYDKGTDFIDGYNDVGFYVLEDPATIGQFAVGEVILDDPNGITGIPFDTTGMAASNYPINLAWAKIMYPANASGSGVPLSTVLSNYPIALFLHGNHAVCDADGAGPGMSHTGSSPCTSDSNRVPNHEGYDYIMEKLASQGIISISISAHEINVRNDAWNIENRGRLIIKYLDKLKDWNDNGTDPFSGIFNGKINLTKIGLSGHSRGGEGVVAAEELNQSLASPYSIVAINTIAPTDLARNWGSTSIFDISDSAFFLLLGARDGDVWDFQGNRIYDRAYRSSSVSPINDKMSFNVYGANHNYFNTTWTDGAALGSSNPWAGAADNGSTTAGTDIMLGSVQRNVGQRLICAFFRKYLKDEQGYKEVFTGRIKLAALPNDKLFMTYQDKMRKNIDNFENTPTNSLVNSLGGAVSVSGFTNNNEIHMNNSFSDYSSPPTTDSRFFHSTLGLKLTWSGNATYESNIPAAHKDISTYKYLSFRVSKAPPAAAGSDAINLFVNIEDNSGNQAMWDLRTDQFDIIPQPFHKNKPAWAGGGPVDMISLTSVRIPLQNFTMNNSGVDLTDIKKIIIKTMGASEIGLDDIEVTN